MKWQLLFAPAFIIPTLLFSSCKKESTPGNTDTGPDAALINNGFLCTIGIGQNGGSDILVYNPWGGGPMAVYAEGLQDADDKLLITTNSNNTVLLQRQIPIVNGEGRSYKYFGYQENNNPSVSSFPNNKYLYHLFDSTSGNTEFILKRDTGDVQKFSLECKSHPGYYLTTARWRNASYPTETELVIFSSRRWFFFKQN